jgi:hypothetical protein
MVSTGACGLTDRPPLLLHLSSIHTPAFYPKGRETNITFTAHCASQVAALVYREDGVKLHHLRLVVCCSNHRIITSACGTQLGQKWRYEHTR